MPWPRRTSAPRLAGLASNSSSIYIATGFGIQRIDLEQAGTRQPRWTALTNCSHEGYMDGSASEALFVNASGLALDRDRGVLYVADSGNDAVRTVYLSSGKTETLAGHESWLMGQIDGAISAASFHAPSGLAFDHATSVLYVADALNGAVRAIDIEGKVVSTLAGCRRCEILVASDSLEWPLLASDGR